MKRFLVVAISATLIGAGTAWADPPGSSPLPRPIMTVIPTDADTGDCHFNYDKNGTQIKICDKSAEIGGEIKGVSMKYPLGKGKAAIPQAGRDIESVAHHAGQNIENGAHWVGDRLGIHIHW